jgi:hypothetical protein
MTVFHVNLLSTFNIGDLRKYPICEETSSFSLLFLTTIEADMKLLGKERFIRWCNLSEIIVPKLTVSDFKEKLRGNLN